MSLEPNQYVPVLKWRMGEYQALLRLEDSVKDMIVPLIVIPPIEWDFEDECLKKTPEEHVEKFGARYKAKWDNRPAFIDIHPSLKSETRSSGEPVGTSIFRELRESQLNAVPVFSVKDHTPYLESIRATQKLDMRGGCLRVTLNDLMDPQIAQQLSRAYSATSLQPAEIDLVIDLAAPKNFEPYENFAAIVAGLIQKIGSLADFRAFAIVAAGFPESLAISKPGGEFERREWQLFKILQNKLSSLGRMPTFGDYGIERPEFLNMDMRLIKPAGKVVYTTPTHWLITKGGAFRDDRGQMQKHCADILRSRHYRGEEFSKGDKYIKDCAEGTESTGSLTTWKWVGMNHHMAQIVQQVAKHHDALSPP